MGGANYRPPAGLRGSCDTLLTTARALGQLRGLEHHQGTGRYVTPPASHPHSSRNPLLQLLLLNSVSYFLAAPPSLQQLCRLHILQRAGCRRVGRLPLPGRLVRFLQHREREVEDVEEF